MNPDDSIKSLSDSICWRIASFLDGSKLPNWKSLINKMPKNTFSEKDINKFHCSILQPRGSPTVELLVALGKKMKPIRHLVGWLKDLQHFPELIDLLERGEEAVKQSAPTIVVQPQSDTYEIGKEAIVKFEVHRQPPFQFQWFKGIIELRDQRNNHLHLTNLTLQDSGYYTCRVFNEFAIVFTDWVKVDVCDVPYPTSFNAPLITMHPRSTTSVAGTFLRLYSDAVGHPAPCLQWYRGYELLIGQCQRELKIPNVSVEEHEGFYHLLASNKHGSIKSLVAQVTVIKSSRSPPVYEETHPVMTTKTFNKKELGGRGGEVEVNEMGYSIPVPKMPSSKIALLIGNENYYHHEDLGHLVHPINDAHDITVAFTTIGFKVVSLINLDLVAMNDALKFFYQLLEEKTYAVFYFAGHGFEIDGESYLMPVDATDKYLPSENLSLSDVLLAMTTKSPMLSVLLLDCCRTKPEYCCLDPIPKLWHRMVVNDENDRTRHVQRKNVIIGFGCCSQGRVLESPLMTNGYFAKGLKENIIKDIKIDDVLFEVSKAIHHENIVDPATGRTQVVYRHSTVVEDLKLTDQSQSELSTELSDEAKLWCQAHIEPASPVAIIDDNHVTVELVFTAEFSNSLLINSNITTHSNTSACHILFILPKTIGGAVVEIKSPEEKNMKASNSFVRISNLERLEGNITIHVKVGYEVDGEVHSQLAFYEIKEKPLYSKIIEQVNLSKLKLQP